MQINVVSSSAFLFEVLTDGQLQVFLSMPFHALESDL